MARQVDNTYLTDAQWAIIERFLLTTAFGTRGRPSQHGLRELLNAFFYFLTAGCVWRVLPHELPPWKTGYHYFHPWSQDGTLERMHTALLEKM